jgi:hypothetical protein
MQFTSRFLIPAAAFVLSLLPAAQAATFSVTTTADSGVGSLRAALASAAATSGVDVIVFQTAGTAITLASILTVSDAAGVTIEGGGMTLKGGNAVRIFSNAASSKLTLKALNITGDNGSNSAGGAVSNAGQLTIDGCAFYGNTSGTAGGGAVNPPRHKNQNFRNAPGWI